MITFIKRTTTVDTKPLFSFSYLLQAGGFYSLLVHIIVYLIAKNLFRLFVMKRCFFRNVCPRSTDAPERGQFDYHVDHAHSFFFACQGEQESERLFSTRLVASILD